MNVKFISRYSMKLFLKSYKKTINQNYCIISVSDTNKEKEEMRQLHKECASQLPAIFLNFADVEDSSCGLTDSKINKLLSFLDTAHKKNQVIVVHCLLGVSRSGAIAKFTNDYYGLQQDYLDNYQLYNKYIYNQLMEASGVETMKTYYSKLEKNK